MDNSSKKLVTKSDDVDIKNKDNYWMKVFFFGYGSALLIFGYLAYQEGDFIGLSSSIKSKSSSSASKSSSSNQSSSSSYSSCTSGGAKSFAKKRVKSTIGMVQFLDLHRDLGNKWLFYGSAYSSIYQRAVTIWVLVNCSNGNYDVENVDVDI